MDPYFQYNRKSEIVPFKLYQFRHIESVRSREKREKKTTTKYGPCSNTHMKSMQNCRLTPYQKS